jgi:hypothetical protein
MHAPSSLQGSQLIALCLPTHLPIHCCLLLLLPLQSMTLAAILSPVDESGSGSGSGSGGYSFFSHGPGSGSGGSGSGSGDIVMSELLPSEWTALTSLQVCGLCGIACLCCVRSSCPDPRGCASHPQAVCCAECVTCCSVHAEL